MRLGLKPCDTMRLAMAPAHRFGSVPAASVLDRRGIDFTPGLYENDTIPDCTAVALVNVARSVALLNGTDLVISPACVPAFYGRCVGNPPSLEASSGAVALDVLALQAQTGFDLGPQALVGLSGTVALNRNALALGLDRLGGGYWGVTLRERDIERRPVWDIVAGRDDGQIVGGHMLSAWDYTGLGDDDTVRVGTWGSWQAVSWGWVAARLEEAHGLVWRQLARPDGSSCGSVSVDALAANFGVIS